MSRTQKYSLESKRDAPRRSAIARERERDDERMNERRKGRKWTEWIKQETVDSSKKEAMLRARQRRTLSASQRRPRLGLIVVRWCRALTDGGVSS